MNDVSDKRMQIKNVAFQLTCLGEIDENIIHIMSVISSDEELILFTHLWFVVFEVFDRHRAFVKNKQYL